MKSAPTVFKKTLSNAVVLAAVSGVVLHLPGCGGGGNSEGAPFHPAPIPSTPVPAPLRVNPGTVDVFINTAATLTISGGVVPYRAFSSSPSILPVAQDVLGSTVTLLPSQVTEQASTITITITDAAGTSTSASVNVKSAAKATDFKVTPNTVTPNCGPAVCAGQNATAQITLTGATGAPIIGRRVRFEALQGQFSFILDDAGTQFAKSITVVTDSTGRAIVRLKADVTAATAFALIRATDVVTGVQNDQTFSIAEAAGQLSISPPTWSISGAYKGVCASDAEVGYYIFGGAPPYRVVSSVPSSILVGNSFGGAVAQSTTVTTNGGYFIGRTNGGCISNTSSIIFITDANGRTVGAGLQNTEGTEPVPTPPPPPPPPPTSAPTPAPTPPPLVVAPAGRQTVGAAGTPAVCNVATGYQQSYVLSGGTPPYRVVLTPFNSSAGPAESVTPIAGAPGAYIVSGSTFSVTFPPQVVSKDTAIGSVSILDNGVQSLSTGIDCK